MDFYYLPGSAPCRAVQMTAATVGVELNPKLVNLMNGEQLRPEFLKLNPQHCLPTLVDGDFVLWESRAIAIYLVEQYGSNDDQLYPKEPRRQAVVNQRLFFDATVLYPRFAELFYPGMRLPKELEKLDQAVAMLDKFLDGKEFVAGGTGLTVADISILATVTTFDVAGYDLKKYGNVHGWYMRVSDVVPGWKENRRGALQAILYRDFFQVYYPKYFVGEASNLNKVETVELLQFLDQFLDGIKFLTGDEMSYMDHQVVQTIDKIQAFESIVEFQFQFRQILEALDICFQGFPRVSSALHGIRVGPMGIPEAFQEVSEHFKLVQTRCGGVLGGLEVHHIGSEGILGGSRRRFRKFQSIFSGTLMRYEGGFEGS